jgi:hypothetical protein
VKAGNAPRIGADTSGQRLAVAARALERIEAYLARPPRIAVLGEFNTGKSSLINLLLGSPLLPAGVLTRTDAPHLLRHAEAPLDILRHVELLDTPGSGDAGSPRTAADEDVVTRQVGRAHGAVWCTLATQAWKNSEQSQWLALRPRLRRNSLLVVTHGDSLHNDRDRGKVLERLQGEAGELFGGIALVSITRATRARGPEGQVSDAALWRESGGESLSAKVFDLIGRLAVERSQAAALAARRITRGVLGGEAEFTQSRPMASSSPPQPLRRRRK